MPSETDPRNHLVCTRDLGRDAELAVSHPLNEKSQLFMTRLSDRTGLKHLGVSLARLPPGRESFALHRHTIQEEWLYVLSGKGRVRLDDDAVEIGPGDFVGLPANGPAHLIINDGAEDLVYLQGGDRREGDRGEFPELGLIGFEQGEGHMALVRKESLELRPFSDWVVKTGD